MRLAGRELGFPARQALHTIVAEGAGGIGKALFSG
jgi:hypothetical protein